MARGAQLFGSTNVIRGVMEHRAEGTGIWIAAFLAVALAMIVLGLGWLAFGPPIR